MNHISVKLHYQICYKLLSILISKSWYMIYTDGQIPKKRHNIETSLTVIILSFVHVFSWTIVVELKTVLDMYTTVFIYFGDNV